MKLAGKARIGDLIFYREIEYERVVPEIFEMRVERPVCDGMIPFMAQCGEQQWMWIELEADHELDRIKDES